MKMQKIKKANLDWGNLPFSYIKTDYNIRSSYKDGQWSEAELYSDDMLTINMAAPCLHYGQQAFEGLKVFESVDGRIIAFRPDENARRLQRSSERIFIPPLPIELFINMLHTVVAANARFIPPYGTGANLYVRPLVIGTGPKVGLGPADEYQFIIFVTPTGPYYKGGFKPVKALVIEDYDRAAPLGVGDCKVGGNYAAGLKGSEHGKRKGFPIVLYLDPKEKKFIDEFGTSNFIGIKNNTYLTPDSESILPSITNLSLAIIAQDLGLNVDRRPIEINEIETFQEIGAVGTAAVITPINLIHYRDQDFLFGNDENAGPISTKLHDTFTKIQTNDLEDKFDWLDEIEI